MSETQTAPEKSIFLSKAQSGWDSRQSLLCVGLDTVVDRIPQSFKAEVIADPKVGVDNRIEELMFRFNRRIIDETNGYACAFKPQSAFYEAEGVQGLRALHRTREYITETYGLMTILDAKRGDIGSTVEAYKRAHGDLGGFDAVTLNPYLGDNSLDAFIEKSDMGCIVLVKTSNNPGADRFQNRRLALTSEELDEVLSADKRPLTPEQRERFRNPSMMMYEYVAHTVAALWNTRGNCGVVVGATYPREVAEVRGYIGDVPILLPGLGTQLGEMEGSIRGGVDSKGYGLFVNVSRGIQYKSSGEDFAQAAGKEAKRYMEEINKYR